MYYKVVDQDLKSAIVSLSEFNNKIIVQYKLNKWVKSRLKDAPLFVFDNLKDAIIFYKHNSYTIPGLRIFTCECRNTCPIDIDKISKVLISNHYLCSLVHIPFGTRGCQEVKLIKEIKHENIKKY